MRENGTFRLDGDFWTVQFDGVTVRVRDAKGMRYLAHLLRHPDRAFSAEALAATASTANGIGPTPEQARSAVGKRIRSAIRRVQTHHPALGHFLTATVHTGYSCSYCNDPGRPVQWES